MSEFNPAVPEAPEPNYLRYSRPSNYAPVNKAAGEAIKSITGVVGQAGRAADSVVTEGIKSYVGNQAQDFSQQHIAGLEGRLNELVNPSPTDPNTPRDIKNLPGKIDALDSAKAKGSFVQAQYDSQLYGLAKDMRSKFPAYRDIIDREVSRASGAGMANPYARALQSSINAIEGKIDNEQKRKENIVDTYTKEGNISPVMRSMYDQGKLTADYLIHEGTTRTFQARNLEMATKRNAYEESGYKLNAVKAEHGADNARDIFLAQTVKDASVVQGTETTPKFLQFKADLDSGRKQYLTPEEQQQFQQSLELGRQRYISRWDEYTRTSGLAEAMGSEAYTKKRKEAEDVYNTYQGLSNPKDYVQQHSFQKWMETKTEGDKMGMELSPTGELLRRQGIAQGMAKGNLFIERQLSDMLAKDPNMDKGLHGFLYDNLLKATTGGSTDGSPNPSGHTTLNDLNRLGFKGTPASMVVNWSDMIKDPNVPDDAKRSLVDYFHAGDGTKIFTQLAKESPTPVQGKDYTVSAEGRPITKGRYYLADKLFSPETVDAVHKLGGQTWQTYKDSVTSSTRTMLGSEIPDLNKYAEQGYQFSWDNKNSTLSIAKGKDQLDPQYPAELGKTIPAGRVTSAMQREVDNVNRILGGIKNVASKEPNIDVNAYLLKALQEGGLGNNEASKAIMQSIISSHKSSALPKPGETMSDAGDQMGMGATAMNIRPLPGQTQIKPGSVGGEGGAGGYVPGTFSSGRLGKEIPPQLPNTPEPMTRPEPTKAAKPAKVDAATAAENLRDQKAAVEIGHPQSVVDTLKDHPNERVLLEHKMKTLDKEAQARMRLYGHPGEGYKEDKQVLQDRIDQLTLNDFSKKMLKEFKRKDK